MNLAFIASVPGKIVVELYSALISGNRTAVERRIATAENGFTALI